jgi:hypothetical protein
VPLMRGQGADEEILFLPFFGCRSARGFVLTTP